MIVTKREPVYYIVGSLTTKLDLKTDDVEYFIRRSLDHLGINTTFMEGKEELLGYLKLDDGSF